MGKRRRGGRAAAGMSGADLLGGGDDGLGRAAATTGLDELGAMWMACGAELGTNRFLFSLTDRFGGEARETAPKEFLSSFTL